MPVRVASFAAVQMFFSYVEEDPALRFIKAGSLDDSSWVSVSASYWTGSAQPWAPADESTHCFVGNPEF